MPKITVSERINRLFDQEKWAAARRLMERELAKLPADDWMRHWWLTRLSAAYYEERDYTTARQLAEEAAAIAPDCPLVLWDLAGVLDTLGDKERAVQVYTKLLNQEVRAIARDQCGEGMRWARGLLTDCWYRIAACYSDKGDDKKAFENLNQFRIERAKVKSGIYTSKEADELSRCLCQKQMTKHLADSTNADTLVKMVSSASLHCAAPSNPRPVLGATSGVASLYTVGSRTDLATEQHTNTTQTLQIVPVPAVPG